jgi:serine/threonine protein kinase
MSSSFIGKVLDNYRILEHLGVGGMGVVFKAVHVKLDKVYAIKMIAPGLSMNENFIKRFQSEAKSLAKFEDPNIVRIYDLRSDNDQWFIVMEFVEGINLSDIIAKDGAYDWQEALPILKQILTAIGHAHRAGIIHRDIKPNNVMITKEGSVKITDFGLAKDQTKLAHTLTIGSGGTLFYMSPEHIRGLSFTDKRSDIYSIGMTLYEMITGSVPFKNMDSDFDIRESIVRKEFEKPTAYNPDIPLELEKIVMKSVAKKSEDRYQTIEEMLQAVVDFESKYSIQDIVEDVLHKKQKASSKKGKDAQLKKVEKRVNEPEKPQEQKFQKKYVLAGALALIISLIFVFFTDIFPPALDEKEMETLSSLTIACEPEPALIYINGDSIGHTPIKKYSLLPGKYSLRVIKEDYIPVDTTILINDQSDLDVAFSLRAVERAKEPVKLTRPSVEKETEPASANASMSFQSNPNGAEIWINRELFGTTPMGLQELKPGIFLIEIKKDGYERFQERIELDKGMKEVIEATLIPFTGGLSITKDPPSAIILLDGKKYVDNHSPLVDLKNIIVGKHRIEIVKSGFSSFIEEVEIKKNEIIQLNTRLVQLEGTLSIHVRPWGSIYINDELKKASSDVKYEVALPVDQYNIKVVHPTLGRWQKNIQINTEATIALNINFNRKIPVSVSAFDEQGHPLFGEIILDAKNTGKSTPEELNVRIGVHKLSVKKDGYRVENGEKEVFIDEDFSEPLTFILKKNEK